MDKQLVLERIAEKDAKKAAVVEDALNLIKQDVAFMRLGGMLINERDMEYLLNRISSAIETAWEHGHTDAVLWMSEGESS